MTTIRQPNKENSVEKRLGMKAWNISLKYKKAYRWNPCRGLQCFESRKQRSFSKDIEELADQVYQAFSTIWICLSKKPWYSPRSGKRTQLFTSGAKGVSSRIKIYQTKIS